jgi:uncharacterized protein YgbK (DUF1537 family)
MLLGCIADDFTGATDHASTLVKHGMCTIQHIGVPRADEAAPDANAVVVVLKSRTTPARQAVSGSLAILGWLRAAGCQQIFPKYCSTFDSTSLGDIGPVADALLAALGAEFALARPASPRNARSVYNGYLLMDGVLLHESGVQNHPFTPMPDANLVRLLSRQTDGAVGLVANPMVEQGSAAIRDAIIALAEEGRRYAIIDAVGDPNLMAIGEAAAIHAVITGGSGIAMGLPANLRRAGLLPERADPAAPPILAGATAGLAGSCACATLRQLGFVRRHMPVFDLDPLAPPDTAALSATVIDWASGRLGSIPIVIAATAPPDKAAAVQRQLGRDAAVALIEEAMAHRRGFGVARRAAHRRGSARPRGPWYRDSACEACESAARSIPAYRGIMPRAARHLYCSRSSQVISARTTSS